MNAPPIHVSYGGKLIKARNREMIDRYCRRFFTPYAFVVWGVVAFELNNCTNVPLLVLTVSFVAAIHNAINTYHHWRQDLMLISEGNIPKEDWSLKTTIAGSDFMIHFLCLLLSFWWIDDFHMCIPLERPHQPRIWLTLIIFTFVLHVVQYNVSVARQHHLVSMAYRHCTHTVV